MLLFAVIARGIAEFDGEYEGPFSRLWEAPIGVTSRPRDDSRLCFSKLKVSQDEDCPATVAETEGEKDPEPVEDSPAMPFERRLDKCFLSCPRSRACRTFKSRTFRLSRSWLLLKRRTRSILRS